MGGSGSGRWNHTRTRRCVESCFSIGIAKGRPEGARSGFGTVEWPRSGFRLRYRAEGGGEIEPFVVLSYAWGGVKARQVVPLASTGPHYGGRRRWFVCPGCRRRAAKLHHPGGQSSFRCRPCHGLAYESARLSRSLARWLFLREARARGVGYSEARDDIRRRIGGRVHETRYLHL